MTGPEWYEKIIEDEPALLVHCDGTEIWIHPPTGVWVAKDGIMGADELFRKLAIRLNRSEKDLMESGEGAKFWSRRIGKLTRVSFRGTYRNSSSSTT